MKKILLIFSFILTTINIHADRIDYPSFDSSALTQLIMQSVETAGKETKLSMTFVHLPNYWCSLDSVFVKGGATGKLYTPVRCDNYIFGEKQSMPESGMHEFALYYENISPSDSIVDLIENGKTIIKGLNIVSHQPKKFTTRISGTYPKKETFISIAKSSPRLSDNNVWVPVKDGKFSYVLRTDSLLFYEVLDEYGFLKGHVSIGRFISENTDINVTFSGKDDSVESVRVCSPEGTYTKDMNDIFDKYTRMWNECPAVITRDSLIANEKYYSPELHKLQKEFEQNPEKQDSLRILINNLYNEDRFMSDIGREAENNVRIIGERQDSLQLAESARLGNFAGLVMLVNRAWFSDDTSYITHLYRKHLQGKCPGNEYDAYLSRLCESQEPVVGNRFNDFTAPGTDGNDYRFSDLIAGKPALLNLWATTCGPCRRHAISMIPVYDEFADKGFRIVGVAREKDNGDDAIDALAKDGCDRWFNLLEINDANGIWEKYRCMNAMGGTFLISSEGIIVAVNPSAEEVRQYLQSL